MNFVDCIEVELKQLEKEAKSVSIIISNRIGKLLESIVLSRESKSLMIDKQHKVVREPEPTISQVLSALLMTYESKSTRLILQSLVVLHKIMSIQALPKAHYEQVLSQLVLIKHFDDANVQRRIMQTCLKFINPLLLSVSDLQFVVKVYTVCFQVATCKTLEIQKIAVGGLLQLTDMIFSEERFQGYTEEEVGRSFGLLGEFLAYVVENKNVQWIPKGMLGIVWDIILDSVSLQGARIIRRKELDQKLHKFSDSIAKKCFVKQGDNKFDFIRFYRGMVYMAIYLKIGLTKLQRLELVLELDRGFMLSVYVEGMLAMISSTELCGEFDTNLELLVCFEIICRIAQDVCFAHSSLKLHNKRPKSFLKTSTVLLTIDPTDTFDDATLYRSIIFALVDLRLAYDKQFQIANEHQTNKMRKSIDRVRPFVIMIYRYLNSVEVDEDQMRKSVIEFQQWFILCSRNKMNRTRTVFLEELAAMARRMDKRCQAIKSSQSIQIMFNLIYGYQDLLDSSNLSLILKCLKDAQEVYYKHKNNKQWDSQIGHELESVMNMIAHLYEKGSIQLTDQSLKNTVEALNEVTLSVLEELADSVEAQHQYTIRMKTFGVRKMKTVIENNCEHLTKVWNFIVAHFISLCSCRFEDIRIQSVDILSQTISNLLVLNIIPAEQLLSIYFDIVKTKYTDVKSLVIRHLKVYLTDHGFTIDQKSLIQIVKILKLTETPLHNHTHHREQQEIVKLMEAETELNEVILKECLVHIVSEECLAELIANYRIISNSKNHEYSGVEMMWLIADHIREIWIQKHPKEEYNEAFMNLHTQLFKRLQKIIINNTYHEVRQSGIHILTQIIAENIKLYSKDFLTHILNGLYLHIFAEVINKYLKQATTAIQDQQNVNVAEWLSTSEQTYKNLKKLIKRLKAEEILDEPFVIKVLEVINNNLQHFNLKMFYRRTVEFLMELKQETLKENYPIQIQIKQKVKNRLVSDPKPFEALGLLVKIYQNSA